MCCIHIGVYTIYSDKRYFEIMLNNIILKRQIWGFSVLCNLDFFHVLFWGWQFKMCCIHIGVYTIYSDKRSFEIMLNNIILKRQIWGFSVLCNLDFFHVLFWGWQFKMCCIHIGVYTIYSDIDICWNNLEQYYPSKTNVRFLRSLQFTFLSCAVLGLTYDFAIFTINSDIED